MRIIYITAGIISLTLALAGVVLPLLPATPFLLLSAICFAKSSERLHVWLVNHPSLGVSIKEWNENGMISRKNKMIAMIMIGITVLISLLFGLPLTLLAIQILVLSMVSLFILTRPDERKMSKM